MFHPSPKMRYLLVLKCITDNFFDCFHLCNYFFHYGFLYFVHFSCNYLVCVFSFIKRIVLNESNFYVILRYYNSVPAIRKIQQISTPSRSFFWTRSEFPSFGCFLISTSKGIEFIDSESKPTRGGKVLCRIY